MSGLNKQRGQTFYGPDGTEVPVGAVYEALGQRYRYGGRAAGWQRVGLAQSPPLDKPTFDGGVDVLKRELVELRKLVCFFTNQEFVDT
jgi:hypothetical protein